MKCFICQDEWSDELGGLESFVDHLRVNHPDNYEEPERWPDGQIVVTCSEFEPEDFE